MVKELADRVISLIDSQVTPIFEEPRPGDIRDSMANTDLARRFLGYETQVKFEEGLQNTVAWHLSGVGARV